MKTNNLFTLGFILLAAALGSPAFGQSYTIDWYKIAGGGGTSAGGSYQVSGTIGQADASGAMSGGSYSLTGGFWSIISTVPAAGVPELLIIPNGPNSVQILWPASGSYNLLQSGNLAGGAWTTNHATVTTANGTNSITITAPQGNLFFRLSAP